MPIRKIVTIIFAVLVLLPLLLTMQVHARNRTDWTVVIYMEAGMPNMHYWAYKNMHDMAKALSDAKKLNIVVQVHIDKTDAWRYLVRRDAIKPLESVTVGSDCVLDLVDAMQWAVENYPARNYALILWGNGFGILDPIYQVTSTDSFPWDIAADEPVQVCASGECPVNKSVEVCTSGECLAKSGNSVAYNQVAMSEEVGVHRGILFTATQSYMTNAQMVTALTMIQENVLGGKKIAVLGTDCCKMAMLEVAYELKDSVKFLVGSQNCELIDGWNYKDLFSCFGEQALTAKELAEAMVKTYQVYYEKNTVQNTYTLSAIDLSNLDALMVNFDSLVLLLNQLLEQYKPTFKDVVLHARAQCPSMCGASYYLDFGQLYTLLLQELDKLGTSICPEQVATLKNILVQGQDLFKSVVFANSTGGAVKNLQGISLYFPRNIIDVSYVNTPFAQKTSWTSLLKKLME